MNYYKIEDCQESLSHPYRCMPEEMKYVYRSRESAVENAKNIFKRMIEEKDASWLIFALPGLAYNEKYETRPNWESVEVKVCSEGWVVQISGFVQYRLFRIDAIAERVDLENGESEFVRRERTSVIEDWKDYHIYGESSPYRCYYRLNIEEEQIDFWEER